MCNNTIQRGDIYYCDFYPVVGSEQSGCRPAIVIQNNVGNQYSPTTIVAPITSKPNIYSHLDAVTKADTGAAMSKALG